MVKVMFKKNSDFSFETLKVDNLILKMDTNIVLNKINLMIKSKGITFVMGSNGSGKTKF